MVGCPSAFACALPYRVVCLRFGKVCSCLVGWLVLKACFVFCLVDIFLLWGIAAFVLPVAVFRCGFPL